MPNSLTAQAFLALFFNALLFAVIALGGALRFGRRFAADLRWIVGVLAVALAGYGTFWLGFLHPLAGHVGAWLAFAGAAATIWQRWDEARGEIRRAAPVALATVLFVFAATGLLLLYPSESLAATAQGRFFGMPGDNDIPRVFAQIIDARNPTRVLGADWLTSDRPPLQTGLALLAWPLLSLGRIDFGTACTTTGIWFQALWFPATWALLRSLGLRSRVALGVTATLSASGFLMFDCVYVWPKLGAAAFVVLAYLLWFARPGTASRARGLGLGAACAACGCLAHGGVMFSLLPLVALALADAWHKSAWRQWGVAAALFLLLALPWLLYQKFYAPPGNRLVKWHLAGVIEPDARGVGAALRDQYRAIGWRGAWDARAQNFRMLLGRDWLESFNPRADAGARRTNDVAFPLRIAAAWTLGLAALPWVWFKHRHARWPRRRNHILAVSWLAGGLAVWLALMFSPNSLFTHQGSFVTQLLMLALLAAWARAAGLIFFFGVATVQWIGFLATWLAPAPGWHARPDGLAASVAIGCGAGLAALAAWYSGAQKKRPATLEPRAEIRPTQASLHSRHA